MTANIHCPCTTPVRRSAISADTLYWLSFAVKLVLTAGIVVSASVVVERAGPLIGALVVTLPVTVWPAYVFLALDHDAAYLAASGKSGLAVTAVSAAFMLVYLVLAQRLGALVSVIPAVACWIGLAWFVRGVEWTVAEAALLNAVAFAIAIRLSGRFRDVKVPKIARQWYELPLRTALVCALMGAVLVLSNVAGPTATGMIAVYPISTTCTMLILHTRIGGRPSAAVIANGLWGMVGLAGGLFALTVTVEPFGEVVALALTLLVPIAWNMSVWYTRQRAARALAGAEAVSSR